MRYVRPAKTSDEQNVCLSQEGEQLFYSTSRNIDPNDELRVWYSSSYAASRNLPLLQLISENNENLQRKSNIIFYVQGSY